MLIKLVTEFLKDKQIDVIVSSPYKRAIDTIKDLSNELELEIEIVDDFKERKISEKWIEDFTGFIEKQWDDFNYKFADGESLAEVQLRNIKALTGLIQKYKDKTIVIGGHGIALSTIINYCDPSFGYGYFKKIKHKMPWIVEMHFNDDLKCIAIYKYDLKRRIWQL